MEKGGVGRGLDEGEELIAEKGTRARVRGRAVMS